MTLEELEARGGASGLVRRLRLGSPLARVPLLGLPLAAMTSVLAGSGHAATWVVPSSSNAGNQAWLDGIVGPAPTGSPPQTPGPAPAAPPPRQVRTGPSCRARATPRSSSCPTPAPPPVTAAGAVRPRRARDR